MSFWDREEEFTNKALLVQISTVLSTLVYSKITVTD